MEPMDLDPHFEGYPWNPVFDPWSRTPDLGYMLNMGLYPVVYYTGSLVQTPILPTPVLGLSPRTGVYVHRRNQKSTARTTRARALRAAARAHYARAL